MELLFGLALLVAAIVVARLAARGILRRGEEPRTKKLPRLQAELPKVGNPGSATSAQLSQLKNSGLPDLDWKALSDKQATILIDSVHYIETVWARDFGGRAGGLPADTLEAAVSAILNQESYCERVVTWEEGYYETGEKVVPDDACHVAVTNVLKGVPL